MPLVSALCTVRETAEVHPELQLMRPLCCGEVVKYIPLTDLIPTRQTHFKIFVSSHWRRKKYLRIGRRDPPGRRSPRLRAACRLPSEIGVAPPKLSS